MTGEATDLVARLRERATYDKKFYPPADPMWTEAATLIEAQAAEIEGLRKAVGEAETLFQLCTTPARFESASTLNVYSQMTSWLARHSQGKIAHV